MKWSSSILALALAAASLGSAAQPLDLGPGVTARQRFQAYPHIDKAFEAQARGDGQRATAEFMQAQRIAPDSAVIALHLANALRRFGEPARAQAVLEAQLGRNPGEPRLMDALRALRSSAVAAARPTPLPTTRAGGQARVGEDAAFAAAATAPAATPQPPGQKSAALERREAPAARLVPRPPPRLAAPARATQPEPGYALASQAYTEAEKKNFAAALEPARGAVLEAPERIDYQRLLVYLLVENGHYAEAESRAAQLEQRTNLLVDAPWQALRRTARERSAFARFEAADRTRALGDMDGALRHAEASTQQAPEVAAHRLQWLGMLLQTGAHAQALQVAQQSPKPGGGAALDMLRGAALQAQGRRDEAAQAFDAALAATTLSEHERKQYRLIAANAALAASQTARAQELLAPLTQPADPDVSAAQDEIRAATAPVVSPVAPSASTFRLPLVKCFGTGGVAGCDIWANPYAPDAGLAFAQEAYQAYADGAWALAAQKAQQAAQFSPRRLPYRLLRLQALAADANTQQALREADEALEAQPKEAELLALRSRLRHTAGQTEAAAADAQAALAVGGLSLSSEVDLLLQLGRRDEAAARFAQVAGSPLLRDSADPDLAYLAIRVGDDRSALSIFNRAHAGGALPAAALLDAAYAASRQAQGDQAVDHFKAAIDAREGGKLKLTDQQAFEARREVADRSRAWGANAYLGYRGMSPGAVSSRPSSHGDVAQAVGEVYWRPHKFGDGRFWELYGGLAQTLYSRSGDPTGGETAQGAIGVRAKPLQEHNLVLAAERRVRVGSRSTNDWLLRAGYSGGSGLDLRVDAPQWNTLNVFAEAGRFLQSEQDYATVEALAGRSYRIDDASSRLVLFPHLVLGADYSSLPPSGADKSAVGAGLGLNLRYWFREDRHHAPRSFAEFSLQYRARVAEDERGKGVFLRVSLGY